MTRGAPPLSVRQKEIIREKSGRLFPADICKLEGMEGTTTRQVADYIRTMPERIDVEMVVWVLETWIEKHGLKAEYGMIMRYIHDLKNKG